MKATSYIYKWYFHRQIIFNQLNFLVPYVYIFGLVSQFYEKSMLCGINVMWGCITFISSECWLRDFVNLLWVYPKSKKSLAISNFSIIAIAISNFSLLLSIFFSWFFVSVLYSFLYCSLIDLPSTYCNSCRSFLLLRAIVINLSLLFLNCL